jgi:hypothetical protein
MRLSVFDVLDKSVKETLAKITLDDLITEAEKHKEEHAMMFYI